MVPFHLQSGSNARLQATKEEIISKLRQDMIRWEGFRPPLPGTNNDQGLGALAEAFPGGVFPTRAIREFISSGPGISTGFWLRASYQDRFDRGKTVRGVGSAYVDEILCEARISHSPTPIKSRQTRLRRLPGQSKSCCAMLKIT
jgi:hypothetical protein